MKKAYKFRFLQANEFNSSELPKETYIMPSEESVKNMCSYLYSRLHSENNQSGCYVRTTYIRPYQSISFHTFILLIGLVSFEASGPCSCHLVAQHQALVLTGNVRLYYAARCPQPQSFQNNYKKSLLCWRKQPSSTFFTLSSRSPDNISRSVLYNFPISRSRARLKKRSPGHYPPSAPPHRQSSPNGLELETEGCTNSFICINSVLWFSFFNSNKF